MGSNPTGGTMKYDDNAERMKEEFFLAYHLGMPYDEIRKLTDEERKLIIKKFIEEKNNGV